MKGSVRREFFNDKGSTCCSSGNVRLGRSGTASVILPTRPSARRNEQRSEPARRVGSAVLSRPPPVATSSCPPPHQQPRTRPPAAGSHARSMAGASSRRRPASAPLPSYPRSMRSAVVRAAPRMNQWVDAGARPVTWDATGGPHQSTAGLQHQAHSTLMTALRGQAPADVQVLSRRRKTHKRQTSVDAKRAPTRKAPPPEVSPLAVCSS
eukprot:6189836-Prymnesium_polylepis.1